MWVGFNTAGRADSSASVNGVTMGWLLRLVTGGPVVVGAPDSSRVLVINFSVCLVLLSNCYCIRFVVLLASDRLARSSKFLLVICYFK